jgi:hypothetical protein
MVDNLSDWRKLQPPTSFPHTKTPIRFFTEEKEILIQITNLIDDLAPHQ